MTASSVYWIYALILMFLSVSSAMADDWPQWRHDAMRSAVSEESLPGTLQLAWERALAPSRPAWPAVQVQLQFDRSAHGVVYQQTLFTTSSTSDHVMALDTRTGEERWRVYLDGPIRLAPAVNATGVYVASDDGWLYCLDRDTGRLLWKFAGAPGGGARRVLGNERLISAWPARGGPVLAGGKVYFAAGIWPFLGIFLHALDAETGTVLWTNSGDGMTRTIQPHGAPSFATVAPQGHLVVTGDRVIVPGGRSVPAVYDRNDGRLLHFQYDGKRGHHGVFSDGTNYYCAGVSCALEDGTIRDASAPQLGTADQLFFLEGTKLICTSAAADFQEKKSVDWKGKERIERRLVRRPLWEAELVAGETDLRLRIRTGNQLWFSSGKRLYRYDLSDEGRPGNEAAWTPALTLDLPEKIEELIAADERLFVTLSDNRLLCFAGEVPSVTRSIGREQSRSVQTSASSIDTEVSAELSELAGPSLRSDADARWRSLARGGYALLIGIHSGRALEQLLADTDWQIIVLEDDPQIVQRWRRQLDERQVYGTRVSILQTTLAEAGLPAYLASFVTSEEVHDLQSEAGREFLKLTMLALRPYGGRIEFRAAVGEFDSRGAWLEGQDEYQASWHGPWVRIERPGAVAGTDDWTHQYGNAGQTGISNETLVRLPLGLLWFGGPSHEGILPRHGHGPSPQVAGGRITIEGPDCLRCLDVYTGRLLWEKAMPGLGKFYDNTKHMPGAGEIGSNYVTLAEQVYVVYGKDLLELDAATGETRRTYRLETDQSSENASVWGYLGVWGDYLVTTSSPVTVIGPTQEPTGSADDLDESGDNNLDPVKSSVTRASGESPNGREMLRPLLQPTRYASGSRRIHVFQRSTGRELWSRDAEFHYRHNAIALGRGRLFCLDRLSDVQVRALERRGYTVHDRPTLQSFELETGKLAWQTQQDVFGTFLNYSEQHDVLVQGGSVYRDRAYDESDKGLAAYRGSDGTRLWYEAERVYGGPCLLWQDRILTNGLGGSAYDLFTGQAVGWEYRRDYGCNTAIGCQNLLTFRSGAAGYCDLANDSGTGTLGGFRSSCTNNLIPANGVLAAPDYTRTCNCAYQNQTSLGLVHWPEAEYWTFGSQFRGGGRAINWGAPGDRRAADGTLWIDLPNVGGPSPEWQVTWEPADVKVFRHHASQWSGDWQWICASGIEGIEKLVLPCSRQVSHRLRLYFSEPELNPAADRIFDVHVDGRLWLEQFSPARAAGGERRGWVCETIVRPTDEQIEIQFRSHSTRPPILCGVELLEHVEEAPRGAGRQLP